MAEEQAANQNTKPAGNQGNRENRPPREGGAQGRPPGGRPGSGPGGDRKPGDRGGQGGGDRREGRPGGGGERRFDGPPEIELDKLVGDSLYLDNQAHIVVSRMRDMD